MSRLKSRSIVAEMRVKQGIYVAVLLYPYLIDTDFRVNVMADEKAQCLDHRWKLHSVDRDVLGDPKTKKSKIGQSRRRSSGGNFDGDMLMENWRDTGSVA